MKKKLAAASLALAASLSLAGSVFASTSYETDVKWGVNLRTSPSTSSKIIRMIHTGEDIHVISKVNAYWLKVQTKDGRIGYISASSRYTVYKGSTSSGNSGSSTSSSSSKADAIIATAKSLMYKAEYDYGTRNPSKLIFDCSSFTQYVFAKHGIDLKWGTRYQKNAGTYVSKSNLKKGDLVFFSVGSSSEIGHVGIYVSNGDFIHILDDKVSDVHLSNLNSGYWAQHYVTARRVI
jgi:cell wall-associated NlpC family hydrolase